MLTSRKTGGFSLDLSAVNRLVASRRGVAESSCAGLVVEAEHGLHPTPSVSGGGRKPDNAEIALDSQMGQRVVVESDET